MRQLTVLACAAVAILSGCQPQGAGAPETLRVVLIPADGGTEDGTLADYRPVFDAVGELSGLSFDLTVGQSYNAVVEAMCNGNAEVAFMGPVTYLQARELGCAEVLAVGVQDGASVYYAGLLTAADAPYATVADLKGASVAFGDVNSASSFVFPMAMILDAGLDPVSDLSSIRLTGSHANGLAMLAQGQVDVAAASLDSYEKAVGQGAVDPAWIRVLARSEAIPYPPLVMSSRLPEALKTRLKEGFAAVHEADGVSPEMIRGYGGKKVDRYDTSFASSEFDATARVMARIDDRLREAILDKAGQP